MKIDENKWKDPVKRERFIKGIQDINAAIAGRGAADTERESRLGALHGEIAKVNKWVSDSKGS